MLEIFSKVKVASRSLALIPDARRDEILLAVADAILANEASLLEANAKDLSRMDKSNPLYDRLQLTPARLADIASDMRHVAALPSPLGRVLKEKTLENGLHLRRVSVPFGVIGMVYDYLPFAILPLYNQMLKMDKNQIEAAADLGANPVQVFFKNIIPMTIPGIVSACMMTFMPTMSSYVIANKMSENTTSIIGNLVAYWFSESISPVSFNVGSVISLVMLMIIGITLLLEKTIGNKEENQKKGGIW